MAAALTGRHPPDHVRETMERLADAQLLETTPEDGRYQLHDLLRLFARERLAADEPERERSAALERALGWYLATGRQAARYLRPVRPGTPAGDPAPFPSYAKALGWLEAERPNLVAAIRQAAQQGWDRLSWQLAEVLWAYFKLRRYWDDWQETAELGLLAARRAGDRAATGRLLHDLGHVLRDRRHPDATALLEESLAIFRALGDHYAVGQVLRNFGLIVEHVRGHRAARGYWKEALTALAPLQVPETASIQRWLDHPGLPKPWWSELEL